jgi:hypothetical protein
VDRPPVPAVHRIERDSATRVEGAARHAFCEGGEESLARIRVTLDIDHHPGALVANPHGNLIGEQLDRLTGPAIRVHERERAFTPHLDDRQISVLGLGHLERPQIQALEEPEHKLAKLLDVTTSGSDRGSRCLTAGTRITAALVAATARLATSAVVPPCASTASATVPVATRVAIPISFAVSTTVPRLSAGLAVAVTVTSTIPCLTARLTIAAAATTPVAPTIAVTAPGAPAIPVATAVSISIAASIRRRRNASLGRCDDGGSTRETVDLARFERVDVEIRLTLPEEFARLRDGVFTAVAHEFVGLVVGVVHGFLILRWRSMRSSVCRLRC